MHARHYVYATFGRWALQAALPLCNIRALKVKLHAFRLLVAAYSICYTHWITHERSPWCWNMRAACCWEHTHQLLQGTELKQCQHGVKLNVKVINKNIIYKLSEDNINKACLIHTGWVPFSNSVDNSAIFRKSDANGA